MSYLMSCTNLRQIIYKYLISTKKKNKAPVPIICTINLLKRNNGLHKFECVFIIIFKIDDRNKYVLFILK